MPYLCQQNIRVMAEIIVILYFTRDENIRTVAYGKRHEKSSCTATQGNGLYLPPGEPVVFQTTHFKGCSVLLKAPILIAEKSASCMWKRRRASKPFCRLTGKQKLSKRYLPHIRTKNLHLIYIRCRTPGNKPEQALSANWKLRKPSWSS